VIAFGFDRLKRMPRGSVTFSDPGVGLDYLGIVRNPRVQTWLARCRSLSSVKADAAPPVDWNE
jgi:hypothetical protein